MDDRNISGGSDSNFFASDFFVYLQQLGDQKDFLAVVYTALANIFPGFVMTE